MTTEYLREFILLAETGNYSAAAEPLFISEATLSRHIMALEQELGTELFKRMPRSIKLTEAGTIFMPYARQIAAAEDICRISVEQRAGRGKASLSIGFDEALASFGVIDTITKFGREFPEFTLQLFGSSTFTLRDQVNTGVLQLAFVLDTPADRLQSLRYQEWQHDALALLLPASHKLASTESTAFSQLSGHDLLLPQQPSAMYELCVQALASAGVQPVSSASAALPGRAAMQLIESGRYAAVLPRRAARSPDFSGLLVQELTPRFDVGTSVIYNPDTITRAGKLFVGFVSQEAER